MDSIRNLVRDVPDFPKPGIVFKDITPILQSPTCLQESIDALAKQFEGKVDVVAGIDSRGFIFGTPLALKLGLPFVPVRKEGKLPWRSLSEAYSLEYGEAVLELHEDAVQQGQRVLIVDDLLATGGTAAAATSLVRRLGGEVVACAFVIELGFLDGASRVGAPVFSLVTY